MTVPFYVSPEQLMKDRADFARKGISRGRSVLVLQYADGVAFVAENPHRTLHKISELYDRVAFAAVGRYNEYENLRIAGVRLADIRGYSYDRADVTGRGLANAYAQTLGTIFSSGGEKPYEVELFVAELGDSEETDQIYRLTYDGSVADEHRFAVMGGSAEQVADYLRSNYEDALSLSDVVRLGADALGHDSQQARTLTPLELEVAVLDRSRSQPRKFRRISGPRLTALFPEEETPADTGAAGSEATATGSSGAEPTGGEATPSAEEPPASESSD
ncbi:MAG: proteasome subunit alpha [Propionibacteriales bacterium]|nr:proteasome subunit alpha [Propionibacteriales bacterium]